MATGETVGMVDCECGSKASVKEGKNGALTLYCLGCGAQGFRKSPKAVEAMRARLGAPAAGSALPPQKQAAKRGLLDEL